MNPSVLATLARLYERRKAGRTGAASDDVSFGFEKLLSEASASEGDARELAIAQLYRAQKAGILKLIPRDKRDPDFLHRVHFPPANEAKLYDLIQDSSPTQKRADLAGQFAEAVLLDVPVRWQPSWRNWCEQKRAAALAGQSVEPFDRESSHKNARLLALLPELLAWERESLIRFASCVLCNNSKALEALAKKETEGEHEGEFRGKLGGWLAEITGGEIYSLNQLGILPNPRSALVHGPLRLRLDGVWLELGLLHGSCRISLQDLQRADEITTTSQRCLTVENEASFHELAKLRSGVLLIQTSYPGSGTLKLLERLPPTMEYWHFGDSDPAGFQILETLQKMSGRPFQPLHMQPGRQPFEQESLGPPSPEWPFYPPPAESGQRARPNPLLPSEKISVSVPGECDKSSAPW